MGLHNQIEEMISEGGRPFYFLFTERSVPVCFQPAHSQTAKTLVVYFHGAVDRASRKIPVFQPFFSGISSQAHQISISDPSLLIKGDFGVSWYGGDAKFASQVVLRELIEEVVACLGVDRVIFFGSSSGGFAALFFSWHFSGSICICACPQTNVFNYYSGHLDRYRKGCWPQLSHPEDISNYVCMDVCALYSQSFENTVIYLQSAGDYFHFQTQLVPFLSAARLRTKSNSLILENGFWGRLSHSRSVPVSAVVPWMNAVLIADSLETDELLTLRHQLGPTVGPSSKEVKGRSHVVSPQDIQKANKLSEVLLKKG